VFPVEDPFRTFCNPSVVPAKNLDNSPAVAPATVPDNVLVRYDEELERRERAANHVKSLGEVYRHPPPAAPLIEPWGFQAGSSKRRPALQGLRFLARGRSILRTGRQAGCRRIKTYVSPEPKSSSSRRELGQKCVPTVLCR
jgi:hypothetical protein